MASLLRFEADLTGLLGMDDVHEFSSFKFIEELSKLSKGSFKCDFSMTSSFDFQFDFQCDVQHDL